MSSTAEIRTFLQDAKQENGRAPRIPMLTLTKVSWLALGKKKISKDRGRACDGWLLGMTAQAVSQEELQEIFRTNLPFVDEEKMCLFLDGMREYHMKFKQYSDWDINYHKDDNYLNECVHISDVGPEDYWVYSPHFKKVFGLVIGRLFRTKVEFVVLPNPVEFKKSIVVLDKHMNRWLLYIEKPDGESEKARIYMRFPRPGTNIVKGTFTCDSEICNIDYDKTLLVADASSWHES